MGGKNHQLDFEDDFPFPQVGYVNSLEGIRIGKGATLRFPIECFQRWQIHTKRHPNDVHTRGRRPWSRQMESSILHVELFLQ